MGRVVKILGGEGGFFPQDYKLDATCVSGALAVSSTATNSGGEVVNASTTDFSRAVGLYAEAVTYTAAPTSDSLLAVPVLSGLEAVRRLISQPRCLVELRVA